MNSIIGNKYIDVFSNLDIEVSKRLEGEYDVEEIISMFDNFFFNRMFLDITSIKNYKDFSNLQKLSMNINMDKVILLLDKEDSISDSNRFLAKLVNMGIYNFTKDSNNLMYLYDNPNSYKDVAYYQNINSKKEENIKVESQTMPSNDKKVILGIKNVTESAGSTTLTYLIKKVLSDYYSTMAIGINERDVIYFNDKYFINVKEDDFENTINNYDGVDYFVVDLNKSNKDHLCNDVLYLVEPSTIKLNKLMSINPNVFKELSGKKIIINKTLLKDNDIANFEMEADVNVYYNIGSLNDMEDSSNILLPLLEKLGYIKVIEENNNDDIKNENISNKKSIFGLFNGK